MGLCFYYRDTTVVCFMDVFTAFYGGLVVFSVIGFLSKKTGTPIDDLPFAGTVISILCYNGQFIDQVRDLFCL